MSRREPYFDPDPPEPGSPRLLGDKLGSLWRYREMVEIRVSRSPLAAGDSHFFHRNLMIALAVKAGMKQKVVADALGLTEGRITQVVQEMERLATEDSSDE